MLRLIGDANKALMTKPHLAKGCRLCFPGVKAVIFVTGLCDDGCYYCPVSREKLGHDVFFVNEERVYSVNEVVVEIARSGAQGASITGGDPLARPARTLEVIRALKEEFGPSFHIHLYTSGRYATRSLLVALDRAGLDEIRFHPTRPEFLERVRTARMYTSMDVGIEIPIGPGLVEWAKRVIRKAEEIGAGFVNLNELEFVEPNAANLLARGLRESTKRPFTVEGSLEAALDVLEWASRNVSIPVHFCPAPFKDNIQTRNRLTRLARLDARWCERPGRGTLRWAVVEDRCLPPSTCLPGGRIVEAYPTRSRKPVIGEESCG
ncbi:MAG: radical SAM protein [Desulfurococcales archaeon]|nr:radical SAM protein [Desulfurococcales archaeon]